MSLLRPMASFEQKSGPDPITGKQTLLRWLHGWLNGRIAFLPVSLLLLMACSSKPENQSGSSEIATAAVDTTESISVVYERGMVRHEPELTYYLPNNQEDSSRSVYLLFFDPQGKGSFPVERFKGLAETYGVNLIGSHRSRNGNSFEQGRETAKNLVEAVLQGFPGKEKTILLAGFSGGAKVALDAGMALPEVKAVVYAGAPFQANQIQKPVLGFAGTGDMNYADLLAFDQSISPKIPHHLVEWEGKHIWPDSAVFEEALVWIASMEHLKPFDLRGYVERKKSVLATEKDPLKKAGILGFLNFCARQAHRENVLNQELAYALKSKDYQRALQQKEHTMQQELQLKAFYNQAFIDKDPVWWQQEIDRLNHEKGPAAKSLNQRILGHFSLAAYTYSNRMLMAQELALAAKFLEIYRLADPVNPEQAYLRAVLAAKTNQSDQILLCLKEAVDLGFSGKQRMLEQAEFQPIRSQAGFQELVGRVKE